MKLLLHIGPFKTGTSSIQACLRLNRAVFSEMGIWVPDMDGPFGHHGVRGWPAVFLQDKPLADPMLPLPWASPDAARALSQVFFDDLREAAPDHAGDLLVLSSEFLSVVQDTQGFFETLSEIADTIHVLSYVRGLRSIYTSSLQQQIQGGRRLKQLDVPDGRAEFQRLVLDRYIDGFGADAVTVRHFHRDSLVGGDVVADFLTVVGQYAPQGLPEYLVAPTLMNESLPGAVAAWLLTVNEGIAAHMSAEARFQMIRDLVEDPDIRQLPKLTLDDPRMLATIDGNSAADCRWINETFLTGQRLLEVGSGADLLSPKVFRDHLRDWLMSYATPDAMSRIAASLSKQVPD